MNIDLLITQDGDIGLVCDAAFESAVAGAMFDAETRQLTLEHANLDTFDLNIPIEDDIADALIWTHILQVGVIAHDQVQDNQQVPLMLLNDPHGMEQGRPPMRPAKSVMAFERFLKACVAGQPVHRDDLGDEDIAGSVVGGLNRAVLQFAPHLARQRTLEASHDLNMSGPSGPSAPGMGLGGGGGGGGARSAPPARRQTGAEDYPDDDG